MSDSQQLPEQTLTNATNTVGKILSSIKTYNPDLILLEKPKQMGKSISAVIGKRKWLISSNVYYLLNFSLDVIDGQTKCVGLIITQHMPPAKINGCEQIQKDIQHIISQESAWVPGVQFKDAYESAVPVGSVLKPA